MATVETAIEDHATGICRVCTASWQDAYTDVLPVEYVEANIRVRYDTERIVRNIRENDETATWVVALDENERHDGSERLVGVVCDRRSESGVGEVSDLYVHPDRQGEGVGSQLLEALAERQREAGVTEQWVYVFADHDAGIGFYESKGFEADERFAAATVDDVDPDCEAIRFMRSI